MPKFYGETHKLDKKQGHVKPEGCPCGWIEEGDVIFYTIKEGCPVHRLDVKNPPKSPVKQIAKNAVMDYFSPLLNILRKICQKKKS